jgi:hypothetical protein
MHRVRQANNGGTWIPVGRRGDMPAAVEDDFRFSADEKDNSTTGLANV